jgi:hypothetical protein
LPHCHNGKSVPGTILINDLKPYECFSSSLIFLKQFVFVKTFIEIMNLQFSVTEKLQTLQMFINQPNVLGPYKCQLTLQMFQSLTNIVNLCKFNHSFFKMKFSGFLQEDF